MVGELLWGFLYLAAGMLIYSGFQKMISPDGLTRSTRAAGLSWWNRWHSRLVGSVELLLGVAGLAASGPWRYLPIAVAYGVFAGYLMVLLKDPARRASCGCLSARKEVPPSWLHVGLDLAVLVGVALGAIWPAPSLQVLLSSIGNFDAIALVVGLLTAACLFQLVLENGPSLLTAYRGEDALMLNSGEVVVKHKDATGIRELPLATRSG